MTSHHLLDPTCTLTIVRNSFSPPSVSFILAQIPSPHSYILHGYLGWGMCTINFIDGVLKVKNRLSYTLQIGKQVTNPTPKSVVHSPNCSAALCLASLHSFYLHSLPSFPFTLFLYSGIHTVLVFRPVKIHHRDELVLLCCHSFNSATSREEFYKLEGSMAFV